MENVLLIIIRLVQVDLDELSINIWQMHCFHFPHWLEAVSFNVLEAEVPDSTYLISSWTAWLGFGIKVRDIKQLNPWWNLVLMRKNLKGLQPQRCLKLKHKLLGVGTELLRAPSHRRGGRTSVLLKDVLVIHLNLISWVPRVLRAARHDFVS